MKVAQLTSAHPRFDTRIFNKMAVSLAQYGHMVTLIVADGKGDAFVKGVHIKDVGAANSRFDRISKAPGRVFAKALSVDADIYHLHDPELLPIGLMLKRQGKQVLFDAHEDVPKQILAKHYLQPWVRHILSWGFAHFERYACSRLDGVITATPYIRDKFLQINPNSIDINNFPMIGELESSVTWQNKAKEVCYVGNIAQVRGVNELVLAMESTRTAVRLNLVGGFSEQHVESKVRGYKGWENVNYLGVQDRLGVREVMSRSIAGLVTLHPIPNYLDALPIKMFEYMSAGIPVIASSFDLWQSIIEEANCGLCVDPLDPLSVADAIDYLVDHPNEARQMGENGRRAVLSRYNWAQEEKKLLNFYDEIFSQ